MPCTSDRVAGGYGRYGGYGKGYRGGYGRYHDENQDTEKDARSPYYGRHGERSSTGRENRAYGYRAYGRYPYYIGYGYGGYGR
jgi:hypothetical protein